MGKKQNIAKRGFVLLALAASLLAPPSVAAASGGGGEMSGGAMPQASGPRVDPNEAYRQGLAALQARDYRVAARNFRDVLAAVPNDTQTNYFYGVSLIGQGDQRGARRPLERAVRDTAASPADAHLQLGLVYLRLNDRDHAQQRVAALEDMIAHCDAACGDARRQQLQTAHDALAQAIAAPANGATSAPSPQSWLFPSDRDGRAAYAAAVGLIGEQRYAEALPALTHAQSLIGPNADILNYMGFVNRKLGRYAMALGYYREALAIAPNHLGANEYLGELYLEMGRLSDARAQLARLDELCPFGCAQREELARWMFASR